MSSHAAANGKGKDEKQQVFVTCIACDDEALAPDHSGISCAQGHHVCPDCCPAFVRSVLDQGFTQIPVKCATCNTAVLPLTFERQLDEDQRNLYLTYVSIKELQPGEQLKHCPSCQYFESWPIGFTGMDTFYCRQVECSKISCAHCRVEILMPDELGFSDDDFEQQATESSSFLYHQECAELAPWKQEVENALHDGAGMKCPSCGMFGRKDENCTHMRCASCQAMYCYVCGLLQENCDKEDAAANIYSHNVDWDLNPLRCPMYLTAIGEVDDRYDEEDDDACLAVFSRLRTIRLLRTVVADIGQPMFARLRAKYAAIENCGFTLDEIANEDIEIIHRQALQN